MALVYCAAAPWASPPRLLTGRQMPGQARPYTRPWRSQTTIYRQSFLLQVVLQPYLRLEGGAQPLVHARRYPLRDGGVDAHLGRRRELAARQLPGADAGVEVLAARVRHDNYVAVGLHAHGDRPVH